MGDEGNKLFDGLLCIILLDMRKEENGGGIGNDIEDWMRGEISIFS